MSSSSAPCYAQLLSPEGEVLAQRHHCGQPVTYYHENVWRVPNRHVVRLVSESAFVQPPKFMNPLKKNDDVFIYLLEDSIHTLPKEPCRSLVFLKVKAVELDSLSVEFSNLPHDGWNAFSNRIWVGTSEY